MLWNVRYKVIIFFKLCKFNILLVNFLCILKCVRMVIILNNYNNDVCV